MKMWILVALSMAAVASAENIAPLTVENVNGRALLANPAGMTVYRFDPDGQNVSNCTAQCAQIWPPVTVERGTVMNAPLGSIQRADGRTQITYQSHPLYTFSNDQAPGQINGDGFQDVWHVVAE